MADEEMLQDFLLDMDFDELIPVDNFFDSYVGALSKDVANPGQMGVPAPPLPTAAAIDRVYDDPNVSASARGGVPMQPGIYDPSPGMWASGAPPPMAGLPQPSLSPLDVMVDTANTIGGSQMNTGDRFLPAQPVLDVGDGMINGNAGFQELPETSASVEHPSPTMRDSKTRVSRGQTKTERQQMLNKAAQRRYRERKKAKADELKHAVSSLQDKVQELSMVYAEKSQLQDRVNALEKELALKEAKLASFEQQQQDVTSGGGEVARGVCFGENDQNSLESNMTDFGNQFSHEVSKMRSWLGNHGFLSPDGEDVRKTLACSDLSPDQVDELRELGQQCYSSCLRCLSLYTDVDVAQLLSSTLSSKQAQFSGDATEWHHLVETLSLSDKVREDALQLREKYMNKLEELFHTRQCLNLEAVKVLLPQEVGGLSGAGKDWKEGPNFFMRYRHAYDTANVLRRLRNNLAEEQKALAELDYLVYVKLLDPVQLSRCILASFPQHCDVVSLLNAVNASHVGEK